MSNIVNAVLLPAFDKQRNAAAATATDSIAEFASPPSSSFSSIPSSSPLAPPLPPSASSINREGGGAGGEWGGGAGGGGRVDVLMMMKREVAYMKRELSACHSRSEIGRTPLLCVSVNFFECVLLRFCVCALVCLFASARALVCVCACECAHMLLRAMFLLTCHARVLAVAHRSTNRTQASVLTTPPACTCTAHKLSSLHV